jgi:hypothetical protein
MLFNVHKDTGDRVEGYFVPDGFASEPVQVSVTSNDRRLLTVDCDIAIEDLPRVGRHETGVVGFALDCEQIQDLPERADLTIKDAATGFLIYRRNQPDRYVQRRVFRLETTMGRPDRYARVLCPLFAYAVPEVHSYGTETVSQLFSLRDYPSMYFEGRVHITPYQKYFSDEILSVVTLEEPVTALAMKLDAMCRDEQSGIDTLEERELAALLPLAAYFDGVDMGKPEQVRTRLRAAPKSVLQSLEAPLLGQLCGQTPGVGGSRQDLPGALSALSMFDIAILGEEAAEGNDALADELGLPADLLPRPARAPEVAALAEALRDLSTVEAALENDLILYECLLRARHSAREASHGLAQNA